MTKADIIQSILENSNHHLILFTEDEIADLRKNIRIKTSRGKKAAFITCIVRDKDIQLKPEEVVRQLYAKRLIDQYGYPKHRLAFEYAVNFGRERKNADIVVSDKDRPDTAYIIVELKKPRLKEGKNQLRSYCNATGAPIGIWTNGQQISYYHRKDPNYFEAITDIPNRNQSLADILKERFTLKDLILKDKLATERKSLKDIILELEDEVLANAGVDVFEEVFKLIFTKLYDESKSQNDKEFINRTKKAVADIPDDDFRPMEFRNTGQTDAELKSKIQRLFDQCTQSMERRFPARVDIRSFRQSSLRLRLQFARYQTVQLQPTDRR